MYLACSWPAAARTILAAAIVTLTALGDDALAQSRRRSLELPTPEPLPEIAGEAAMCSFAYHQALAQVRDGKAKLLASFESQARVAVPGLPGRWLHWIKTARNTKASTSEQVCAETSMKGGRQRCLRWETRKLDPAIASAAPTQEELTVLRALDSFVGDKGAPLEFGSNGRQFVTLQRVAGELGNYITQPRHPALCNGAQEMMDFHTRNLAGVTKRGDDIAALAAKTLGLARLRVNAAREQQSAEARAAAASAAASATASAQTGEGATATTASTSPMATVRTLPPIPVDAAPAAMVLSALEGLLTPEQLKNIDAEPDAIKRLQLARELTTGEAMPAASPAARGAAGAALRMIEAATYGELQMEGTMQFREMFFGTIEQIREAHRAHCTCGD